MRLTLSTDDGEVMDVETITFEEWRSLTPTGAYALLAGMHCWDEEGVR